jgi:SAM-dependent methyltransferase
MLPSIRVMPRMLMKAGEAWGSGDSYERYVGRWSRLVAVKFLDWLAVGPGLRWLDVGCGTGALTAAMLDHSEPSAVVAVDPSEGYIGWAMAHVTDPRGHFRVADATHLPPGPFDVAVSGLVLNFVPDPGRALACMRAAAPGGQVAAAGADLADLRPANRLAGDGTGSRPGCHHRPLSGPGLRLGGRGGAKAIVVFSPVGFPWHATSGQRGH